MRRFLLFAAGMLLALQALAADTTPPTITIKVKGAVVDGSGEAGIRSLDDLRVSLSDDFGQARIVGITMIAPDGGQTALTTSTMAVPLAQAITATIAEGKGKFEIVKDDCSGKALGKSGVAGSTCTIQVRALATDNGTLSGKLRIAHPQKTIDVPLISQVTGLPPGYLTISADTVCTSNRKQSVDCGVYTLTNTGGFTVNNITVTKAGADPDNFSTTSNCPVTGLQKDGKCTVAVKAVGLTENRAYSGQITATYQSAGTGTWSDQTLSTETRTSSVDVRGWVSKLDFVAANGSGLDVTGPGSPAFGSERIVTVQNTGEVATQTIRVSLVGGSYFDLSADQCSGLALNAGGTCSVKIRPKAGNNGALSAILRFAQNGVNTDLTLTGIAQGWKPATLAFVDATGFGMDVQGPGSPAYGSARSFQVRNDGDVASGKIDVVLLGPNAANVELAGTNTCSGVALDPGSTCLVTARPKASASADYSATLRLTQNQLNTDLGLSGRATRFTPATVVLAAVDGDPNAMNVVGPGNPAYGSTITFRVTNIGDFTTQPVTLKSSGSPNFELVSGGLCLNGVTTLAAGESCTQQVRPKATANGAFSGTITASANNTVTFNLSGTGSMFNPANLKVIVVSGSPSSMNVIGPGAPAYSSAVTVQVKNDGDIKSEVLNYSLSNTGNFQIMPDGTCSSGTTTLGGGESCSISLRAMASVDGTLNGILSIVANNNASVILAGSASGFYTYSWNVGVLGACSASSACTGVGSANRTVSCVRSDGQSVTDGYCTTTKPATSQSCSSPAGSQNCSIANGIGTQQCAAGSTSWGACTVASCNAGYAQSGNSCTPTYTYAWNAGGWGACSATCGGGSQTRSVWCQRSDGGTVANSFCAGASPVSSQSCSTQACAAGCSTTSVSWGNQCSGTIAGVPSGSSMSASYSSGLWSGSATYTCSNGSWGQAWNSCTCSGLASGSKIWGPNVYPNGSMCGGGTVQYAGGATECCSGVAVIMCTPDSYSAGVGHATAYCK